jgi:hypothetical protein
VIKTILPRIALGGSVLERPIDEISEADLFRLIENQVSEGRSLEFKRDLPDNGGDAIKEFLADVSSFANAQGGDLLFGVDEQNGIAIELPGLQLDNADAIILALENRLRDNILPRLIGVRIRPIPLNNGRHVLLIRVPSGMAAPHQVSFRGSGKFYSRNSAGKFQMDVHDLRHAFNDAEGLPSRFHRLHAEAIDRARGREMPIAIVADPTAIVSVFPLSLFREQLQLNVTRDHAVLPVNHGGGYSGIDMIEGVTMHSPIMEGNLNVRSFATTFRDGRAAIAFTFGGIREDQERKQHPLVFPQRFEEGVVQAANSARGTLTHYGVNGPWVVMVSVIAVRNFYIIQDGFYQSSPAYRHEALLGSLQLDEITPEALKPIGDNFWLLFGIRRDPA